MQLLAIAPRPLLLLLVAYPAGIAGMLCSILLLAGADFGAPAWHAWLGAVVLVASIFLPCGVAVIEGDEGYRSAHPDASLADRMIAGL